VSYLKGPWRLSIDTAQFLEKNLYHGMFAQEGAEGGLMLGEGTKGGNYCKAMEKGLPMKGPLLGKRKRKRGLSKTEEERIAYEGAMYLCSHDTLHVG